MNFIFLKSPAGDEIKEVEATAAKLSPYLAAGWHQVAPPAGTQVASVKPPQQHPAAQEHE